MKLAPFHFNNYWSLIWFKNILKRNNRIFSTKRLVFTNSVPRPIHSISHNVCDCVCLWHWLEPGTAWTGDFWSKTKKLFWGVGLECFCDPQTRTSGLATQPIVHSEGVGRGRVCGCCFWCWWEVTGEIFLLLLFCIIAYIRSSQDIHCLL